MSRSTHAIVKGKVQGVGFRYTAVELASQLGLFGTVKNTPEGAVEMIVQGEKAVVDRFLHELAQRFDAEISKKEIISDEQHTTFKITY